MFKKSLEVNLLGFSESLNICGFKYTSSIKCKYFYLNFSEQIRGVF